MLISLYLLRRGTSLKFERSFYDQYWLNRINLQTANYGTAEWCSPQLWGAEYNGWELKGWSGHGIQCQNEWLVRTWYGCWPILIMRTPLCHGRRWYDGRVLFVATLSLKGHFQNVGCEKGPIWGNSQTQISLLVTCFWIYFLEWGILTN